MQSQAKADHEHLQELPPVTPPSGKFLVQLFLVPGLIVAGAVSCIWLVSWVVGDSQTPEQFLKDLRSSNNDVRWRRASDLAQVLKRNEKLAANAGFALDLTELLHETLKTSEKSERDWAQDRLKQGTGGPSPSSGPSGLRPDARPGKHPLQDERSFVEYLIASLGNFSLPVGVPLLNDIARKKDGAEPAVVALRRQLAVWALANVAANLKRYEQLPPEHRDVVMAALETEAAQAPPLRREWARATLSFLKNRAAKSPQAMTVDETLAECAQDDDPTLRKFAALALTFWEGTSQENARMEKTLLALSQDDGHGHARVEETQLDDLREEVAGTPDAREVKPKEARVWGLEIRYQATQALARRGCDSVLERFPVLREMLDEEQQLENFTIKYKDGHASTDGATATLIVKGALQSVAELHRKRPDLDLSSLSPALAQLERSQNPALRQEAGKTSIILKGN